MQQYLANFKNCLQKEPPFCQAECPFHVNVLDFIEKLRRGSFKAAFKDYRNAVGFPLIVSNLCGAPCESVCPRGRTDKAINLLALERACIDFAGDTSPADYNLPKKHGKIAVIGAGISGLSCALRLATKKYDVVVYEKSGRLGGHLWDILDPDIFLNDFEKQFKYADYELRLNTGVFSLEQLDGELFGAVYVATGANGADFGVKNEAGLCLRHGDTGVFAGGALLGKSTIDSIADGLAMGTAIDNFLKTGNLAYSAVYNTTAMRLDPYHLYERPPVLPVGENGTFTKDEAISEANRCIECQCDACRIYCDLTEFYNKWPLRIRDEIQATTLPGMAEVKATPAKRLISTCSQCGLCLETCPEDIDLGGLILAARQSMHKQKKAPWPFHDFWLRDMDFANDAKAALTRAPKDTGYCKYAFFPGCQLGASSPDMVIRAYQYLIEKEPASGIILSCCGVPARWAGDEEKFDEVLNSIEASWKALGQPVLILACPTCSRIFNSRLPHITTAFLYEKMALWGFSAEKKEGAYSVFDQCSSRGLDGLRNAVRDLAGSAAAELEPLPRQEEHSRCCGYGGHGSIANPAFTDFVVNKRISEGDKPYITYCINCRDYFLHSGKEAVHILELIFGGQNPAALPTVSRRRENRITLKDTILKDFWDETMEKSATEYDFELIISDELKEKLNKLRILEEEVYNVVNFCETAGRTVFNTETGVYSGYRQIGYATYWVEYRKLDGAVELVNAYSHRMEIELEVIWNGRKADLSVQ